MNHALLLVAVPFLAASIAAAPAADPGPAEAASTQVSETPAYRAASVLVTGLGPEAVPILQDRGIILFSGDAKRGRQVLHVQRPLFESLARHADAWQLFLAAAEQSRSGSEPAADLRSLRSLQALPLAGFMTVPVRAAVDILANRAFHLGALGPKLGPASGQPPLLETAWGAAFSAETHLPVLGDPATVAEDFFLRHLSGPDPSPSRSHFLSHVRSVHQKDLAAPLAGDLVSGKPSAETLSWVTRYLREQLALWNVLGAAKRLESVERSTSLRKELAELRTVLTPLAAKPGLREEFDAALKASGPRPRGRFTVSELHVHSADRDGTLDLEDTAVVSIAYWVDGLAPTESARVTEAGFLDLGESGIAHRTLQETERMNGGPYLFSAQVPVDRTGPLRYRFHLQAGALAPISRETDIPVSPSLPQQLLAAAGAQQETVSCQFEDSEALSEAVEKELEPLSAQPQFKRLAASVRKNAADVALLPAALEKVQGALEPSRLYASGEQCTFRSDRAEHGLTALAGLPAGCDARPEGASNLSRELLRLHRVAEERRLRQDAFRKTVAEARSLEAACRPDDAAQTYAAAMALLEADPESRCGELEQQFTTIRLLDLPRTGSMTELGRIYDSLVERASRYFSVGDYRGAIEITAPLLSILDALPSRCHERQRAAAAKTAEAAGVALGPLDPKRAAAVLPAANPAKYVESIRAEWEERRRKARAARERARLQESPVAPLEESETPADKPAGEPR
ncbi:MAG: hypothetical protein A2X36_16410 [Elusimicrobia bacterium GWA2_69_24]|nr:MAG: hypothetical protein A2X36_16410 [Elusimicrobia bacterium GWA2_69_24]HBL18441.1 hypothetical protein [Elusimicrobiota bacterium]